MFTLSVVKTHEAAQIAQVKLSAEARVSNSIVWVLSCRLSRGAEQRHRAKQLRQRQKPSKKLTLLPIMHSCVTRRLRSSTSTA